jgi:hypothetical protein
VGKVGASVSGKFVKLGSDVKIQDFEQLLPVTSVLNTGSNVRKVNNLSQLVNSRRAIIISPKSNSLLKQKVDDYMAAINAGDNGLTQGRIGEEIAEEVMLQLDNTEVLNLKINGSGNGFDILAFENLTSNPTKIRIVESKPMKGKGIELPFTNSGYQMGGTWTRNKIDMMRTSPNSTISSIGNILDANSNLIERYVLTIDKELKQIIIIKLDNFN